MNALLFVFFSRKLTGSIFNAFEYYLTTLESNPSFCLYFVNISNRDLEYLYSVFENRYDLEGIDYKKNIISVSYKKITHLTFKLNKVLVLDYGTVLSLKKIIIPKEIIVICEKTELEEYRFSLKKPKITYYGEMPFQYRDIPYRMKLGFKWFKKLKHVKEGVYINSPFNNDFSFLKNIPLPKNKPIIFKKDEHLDNLFEHFDEYIYYHADKWFDPHPRLFLESAFYGKKITYYNNFGIKDGSYYRYKDLMENGLKDRTLSKDDEIIKLLI